jgi:hypothetical protein
MDPAIGVDEADPEKLPPRPRERGVDLGDLSQRHGPEPPMCIPHQRRIAVPRPTSIRDAFVRSIPSTRPTHPGRSSILTVRAISIITAD